MSKPVKQVGPSIDAQYMINMLIAHSKAVAFNQEYPMVAGRSQSKSDEMKAKLLEYIGKLEQRPEIDDVGK